MPVEPTAVPALLSVRDLSVSYGSNRVVTGVDIELGDGESMAMVGESGSGKTTTAMAITRLLRGTAVETHARRLRFEGTDLLTASPRRLRALRGRGMSVIFQNPGSSLNPLHTVGAQIAEMHLRHGRVSRHDAWSKAVQQLDRVGIRPAGTKARYYPHQFSGGMAQRVMIAMALALEPQLLVADEPTSSLDVTVQAGILDLLNEFRAERRLAILLITHNLGVAARLSERIAVMRDGRIVEEGDTRVVLSTPSHAYTRDLLAAAPSLTLPTMFSEFTP